MKKPAVLLFAFFVARSFSLSLSQVRETLGESSIPRDSVEMNIRVSVKAAGVYRRTEIYMASKGAGDVYTIKGSAGTLYYDSRRKRVEKIEASKDGASSVTTFSYDALGGIRKMETSVTSGESGSVVTTEVLRMRKSDKVPDALFEF